MNTRLPSILLTLILSVAMSAAATVRYVDLNSANPTPPFLDWSTAATNIQDAIDAAVDGDQILVTNGWYQNGGKVMAGDLTNRVALNKAVTVQSVNGPWVTTISGAGAINGTAAVRCAWLTNGASLVGFRLVNGATRTSGDQTTLENGGGVWCASSSATVANCVIVSNTAYGPGIGVFQGTINNSLISSNSQPFLAGYAALGANLSSCTVVGNSTAYGVYSSRLTNCIVYYHPLNWSSSTAWYCCTTPASGLTGAGNLAAFPQLFADGVHLSGDSPCIGAGTNVTRGTDIFGRAWANPPAMGCAEWDPGPLIAPPQAQVTGDPVGFTVRSPAIGNQPVTVCGWLKDGAPLQDNGHFSGTQTTNLVAAGVGLSDAGGYQLVLSNANGMATSLVAQVVVHCVDAAGTNPVAPYLNWGSAATDIQTAIAVSQPNDVVLVNDGLYGTGSISMDRGSSTNRIALDKAVLVQGVNGPSTTIIQGAWDPSLTNGFRSIRCVWLTNNAILSGFTLRGGSTTGYGGGAFGAGTQTVPHATVANCVIAGNTAGSGGGGAYLLNVNNCTLRTNLCSGDGGGAYNCYLKNCLVTQNVAQHNGGGTAGANSLSINSALTGNSCGFSGGGAYQGSLLNSTVSDNVAKLSPGAAVGVGVYEAALTNCIIWGNTPLFSFSECYNCTLTFCCANPLASGAGNIASDPQLLDGVHLAASSPCRGAGTNYGVVGTDIDGQAWATTPAIGCDEWQPPPIIWAPLGFQFNLPSFILTCSVMAAGQAPFTCFWTKNGAALGDDGHYINSGTVTLGVSNFGVEDAGVYQVVVSNAFGVATSQVAYLGVHAVDAAGTNPVVPYATWPGAATNIQDAINAALPGDIVLVTNGIYLSGGKATLGGLTNRVVLDKPITVTSINGASATIIQGMWDPVSTNGPGAVRCVWTTNGAVLNGFTLRNGATRNTFAGYDEPVSGGGAFGGGLVVNCIISNNAAWLYGGGLYGCFLANSLVVHNVAPTSGGGGAYSTWMDHCTVRHNYGAGVVYCRATNSIVLDNYFGINSPTTPDNVERPQLLSYSCTSPLFSGTGNIDGNAANPQFMDEFHLASTSPCRGAGDPFSSAGVDLDGEPWANPPSMGCDEVVEADMVGPLSVSLAAVQPTLLVAHAGEFDGTISGWAAHAQWSFGDGPIVTNAGASTTHQWTNPGDYTVTFTAFNFDNPGGVSTSLVEHVLPVLQPQLQAPTASGSNFLFQFTGQTNANYTVQYTTNLAAPVTWQTLQRYLSSTGQTYQVQDWLTNAARFYRVLAQ